MAPSTCAQWVVEKNDGFEGLVYKDGAPIPKVGDNDVLVKIQAVSLNYRDLIIARGTYPLKGLKQGVVPGSDGAGVVEEIGSRVTRFKNGDYVCTLFNQGHIGGPLTPATLQTGLGGAIDGTLRQYGVFNEQGLVKMPQNLSFKEATTLTCAGVTAWNAFFGLFGKSLKAGQVVLTQGTGGVSIFAIQFAVAAGCFVIATTSSNEKAAKLKSMGVKHVINYCTDSRWGETAKKFTPDGEGVDHIVDVGGESTLVQSLKAIRIDGCISIVGFLPAKDPNVPKPSFLQVLTQHATVRGILVGSRLQFEDLIRGVEANNIKPLIDADGVFKFHEAKKAYQYMWDQRHIGKVVIEVG